jgi:hypothetical protein
MRNKYLLFVLIMTVLLLTVLFPQEAAGAVPIEVTNTNNSGPGSLRQAITDANNDPDADTIIFAAGTDGTPIILSGASGENGNGSGDLDIIDGGDLTIMGNGAANTIINGGGIDRVIHVCPDGSCTNTITLSGLAIYNGNAGLGAGGGIFNNSSTLSLLNATIGLPGVGNLAGLGGGLYNAGVMIVDNCIIRANTSYGGGGIYNEGTVNVQNNSIIGGTSSDGNNAIDGGGIYNDAGTTTIDNSKVILNTASQEGGGIYNQATLNILNGSHIGEEIGTGNTADGKGGGVYNENGTISVINSSINNNTTSLHGGGIYNNAGTTTLDNSKISDNTAVWSGGGVLNNATLNVQNSSMIGGPGGGNTAFKGGGIKNSGTTTVDSSSVNGNRAWAEGGGISNNSELIITTGSTIGEDGAANIAGDKGGGIYNYNGSTTMEGSTVSANTSVDYGGGIYNMGSLAILGSRILNNTSYDNGGGVFNDQDLEGATSVTGSCIIGNSDSSLFNNQPSQQTASGNWWGAATGPNTPGADTYSGNLDVSGHFTAPILDCAPDLRLSKINDSGGNGIVGIPFNWILTVRNDGLIKGTFNAGQTILMDDLPSGPSYGPPVTSSFVDVTNSANIFCDLAGNTLSCAAAGANVMLGATDGSFKVTISVTPNTSGTLINPASSGNCWVDPDGHIVESDESDNNCNSNTVDVVVAENFLYLPVILR